VLLAKKKETAEDAGKVPGKESGRNITGEKKRNESSGIGRPTWGEIDIALKNRKGKNVATR